jgi:hypothetical protein
MMTFEEFKENVDLYSADLSRWPRDMVKPALQFVKDDARAKAYFDAALALDDKLRSYAPKAPMLEGIEARVMAEIRKTKQEKPGKGAAAPAPVDVRVTPAWIFAPGGGLLAVAVLGFIIGLMPPSEQPGDTLVDPVYYSQDQIIGGDSDMDAGGMF